MNLGCKAKISNLDLHAVIEEHIAQLQVPYQNGVRMLQVNISFEHKWFGTRQYEQYKKYEQSEQSIYLWIILLSCRYLQPSRI